MTPVALLLLLLLLPSSPLMLMHLKPPLPLLSP
jgi:hypothetical protein